MTTAVAESKSKATEDWAPYSFDELVKAYHDNGFRIIDVGEAGVAPVFRPCHVIRFEGDYPDEGMRGVELAKQQGFRLVALRRVWNHIPPDEAHDPYWEVTFSRFNLTEFD